jgi:3-oxoacyl-[acyl-carrier protein] reductase
LRARILARPVGSGFYDVPLLIIAKGGKPEEIAGLVSYLASAEAGYITGASLTIDGGYVA